MGLEETSTFTYINSDAKIKTVFMKKKKSQKRLQKLQLKGIHPEKNSLGSINKMLTSSSLWKFLETVLEEEFFFFLIFFFNTNSPDGWGQGVSQSQRCSAIPGS